MRQKKTGITEVGACKRSRCAWFPQHHADRNRRVIVYPVREESQCGLSSQHLPSPFRITNGTSLLLDPCEDEWERGDNALSDGGTTSAEESLVLDLRRWCQSWAAAGQICPTIDQESASSCTIAADWYDVSKEGFRHAHSRSYCRVCVWRCRVSMCFSVLDNLWRGSRHRPRSGNTSIVLTIELPFYLSVA